jgi:hypothetical protein
MDLTMRERDMQDYLYDHPEVLFPGCSVQEKAREYAIHGRRIDLLFVVDGVRYIVELKAIPLQRDHIGQAVEYYGLMKGYLREANLRMILVSPSVQEYRAKYLEELGIRCVELSEIPENPATAKKIATTSRASMHREFAAAERDALIQPGDRFVWEEVTSPSTPRTVALARRFLRDSLEPIRSHFQEYEVVPYGVTRWNAPDVDFEYHEGSGYGRKEVTHGSIWWAYRFGNTRDAPPNDIPNISVMAHPGGLDVTLNAELKPSQLVLRDRIGRYPDLFNRILREHGRLWLKTYLKFEHQPRFYHWVLADRLSPGDFDAARILELYQTSADRFAHNRALWIERIVQFNQQLSHKQIDHLNRANRSPNLATRLTHWFPETDPFWTTQYGEQLQQVIEAVFGLKPLIDFFVGPSGAI